MQFRFFWPNPAASGGGVELNDEYMLECLPLAESVFQGADECHKEAWTLFYKVLSRVIQATHDKAGQEVLNYTKGLSEPKDDADKDLGCGEAQLKTECDQQMQI